MVLIIGILAAVAVPQYQKAVVKSKNAEMKHIVKAVAEAERAYYLANGKYAINFNELDIDLPLTPQEASGGHVGACNTNAFGTDSGRQGKDYYVALNSDAEVSWLSVVAYWRKGTYKCAGFGISLTSSSKTKQLHCREMKKEFYYKGGQDNFCKKIEQGTQLDIDSSDWRYYSLP